MSSTSSDASTTCEVQVLLFSLLKEKLGTSELSLTLDAPATGTDLLDALETRHPAVADHRSSLRLAVNQEYVPTTTRLADGDEVALITPVSGG
jgi:molybdopterin converting factor subunit 1